MSYRKGKYCPDTYPLFFAFKYSTKDEQMSITAPNVGNDPTKALQGSGQIFDCPNAFGFNIFCEYFYIICIISVNTYFNQKKALDIEM